MNTQEMRAECNLWLHSLLGSEDLVSDWWVLPNRAFAGQSPDEVWQRDPKRIYQYLAHAGNTEG